jgi:2-methylcitrate dehydratase PrpD
LVNFNKEKCNMADKTISQQIASIAEKVTIKDIDQRTIENAKIFLLDCLGCILSGRQIESADSVAAAADEIGGPEDSTVIGRGYKTGMSLAALLNGVAGHSQDYDDDHREGIQHASVAVLPAVLAAAEKYGKSGEEALVAYIVGSDVTIRAGEAFLGTTYYSGWHPTGTCGVLGATAGVSKLLGLNEEQFTNALGVAGSEAAGLGAFNTHGAWTKRFHAGQSAKNGILAAVMGKHNYFGPPTVFEDRHGWLNGFSYKASKNNIHLNVVDDPSIFPETEDDPNVISIVDPSKLTNNFGKVWEMADNSIKLHSCCRFSNNYCDCAIDIHNQEGFDATKVEHIHADCNNFAIYNLCNPEEVKRHPQNVVNAQFSVCYEIATGLVKGRVLPESFTLEAIKDPLIYDLCSKTSWSLDEEFEAVYPKRYPARVTVTMQDGSTYVGSVEYPKGDPEYPATKEEVTEKFFANASNTIGSVKAKKVAELVDKFETLENLDELFENLV